MYFSWIMDLLPLMERRFSQLQNTINLLISFPTKFRPIFEVNTITGLRYVELQRLHDHEKWYYTERNQIILPKEAQKKVKQKLVKRTVDKLPATFPISFQSFSGMQDTPCP